MSIEFEKNLRKRFNKFREEYSIPHSLIVDDLEYDVLVEYKKAIDFLQKEYDALEDVAFEHAKKLDAQKNKLQQEYARCKKIEKETKSALWREGARWNMKLIEELSK